MKNFLFRLKQIICNHQYTLLTFKGPLGTESSWQCSKCLHITGTETEIVIQSKNEGNY